MTGINQPFTNVHYTHTFVRSTRLTYDVAFPLCRALLIADGTSGDLAVQYQDGSTDVLPDVMPGILPGQFRMVLTSGTEIAAARISVLY